MTGGAGGPRFARPALFWAAAGLAAALSAPVRAAEPADSLAKAEAAGLWRDPRWLRLGHWKKDLFGRLRSDARAEGFFLRKEGPRDPRGELAAMVAGLWHPVAGPEPQHPRCRFPARAAFLIEALKLDEASLPRADCSRFDDWRRLMDPGAVSMIFASAYLNNPASMFGHTFLRLERKGVRERDRLIDNSLNFAAETGDDGGVLFAFKGLFGLYPGKYTAQPYYMMVQQYNNIESRDLWEYRLALSPQEVDRLAMHAWEMGGAEFPYYFLSKNCSYQLMPAIEAALPERSLMPGSPALVAPLDTLNATLASPGLVAGVKYRPSHSTVMRSRRGLLTRDERRAAEAFMRGRPEEGDRLLGALPADRRAMVLDSAQDYVLYKEGYSPDVPEPVRRLEREILVRRAKLPEASAEPPAPSWAAPPDEGHPRKRLRVGAGARRGGSFTELSWRPGYHDLLDRPRGYVPGAEIDALSWRVRYDHDRRRAYLREFKVIDVLSVSPWDPWMRKPSWTVGTGLDTAFEKGRFAGDSLVYEGHVGTGLAAQLGAAGSAWMMAVGEGAAGAVLRDGWRIGGALKAGFVLDLGPRWRAGLDGALGAYVFGDESPNHRLRALINWAPKRAFALRAEGLMRGPHREAGLYALLYH